MIEIKKIVETTLREEAQALANKLLTPLPDEGTLIGVYKDTELKALANIRLVPYIEPFSSLHPVYSKHLWYYLENQLKSSDIEIVRAFVDKNKLPLYEKLGFYQIYENLVAIEKNFK